MTTALSPGLASGSGPVTVAAADDRTPILTFDLPSRQVVVRRVRQSDLRALEWHGGPDRRAFYEDQWVQHCAGAICVLVADFNQYPIGHAAIHWHGKPTHPAIPDLQSVRVAPGFRGLGIGSRLIEAGEKIIAAQGFQQVSLAVGVQNESARRLYERLGYQTVGEPYNDEWHYIDAQGQAVRMAEIVVDMVKNLSG
ncbi:MAG TPA: GNAT family N-acetyltransferase [Abditibacteriaceae bacterium]|nr:GNAT family N-acetyltransferase [Abditibacteriaceae bacterium]